MPFRDPLRVALLSFLSGVVAGVFVAPVSEGGTIALLFLALLAALFAVFGKRPVLVAGLIGGMFLLGFTRMTDARVAAGRLSEGSFRGVARVDTERVTYGAMQKFAVTPRECAADSFCPPDRIAVFIARGATYLPGTQIFLDCPLELVPNREETAHDERLIAVARRTPYQCRAPVTLSAAGDDPSLLGWLGRVRHAAGERLLAFFPPAEGALAAGLLLGGDDRLSGAEQERFRFAGLSHIVAVSGFNMSIVGVYLFFVALILGCARRSATFIVLGGLLLFTLFVGAPASAVRAAIMGAIGFVALSSGRSASGWRLLVLAAALMLWENPLLLSYDLGFQLSVLATIGILVVGVVEATFERRFFGRRFLSLFVFSSVGALLFVIPWSAFVFGTFQPYALVSNVLALPFVPAAFFLSLLGLLLGALLPPLAIFFTAPALLVLAFIRVIAGVVATLPFASVDRGLSAGFVIVWYALLGGAVAFVVHRRRARLLSYVTHP